MAGMTILPEVGRTGVVVRDALPWRQCVQIVQTAEDTGYEAVFVPEISGREAFSSLTGFAGSTSRIMLGTGVVTVTARSPVTTAMAAATLQDLSGGRAILGVGAGSPPAPVASVRDYVRTLRATLSGLEIPMETGLPPIWIGALGDRTIRLAGEVADGVLLNWCTPERVAKAKQLVEGAADKAGRDPASVTIAVYLRACLGAEDRIALAALREMTGRYASLPHYLRQFEAMGLGPEGTAAAKAFGAGKLDEVPESLVRPLTVSGGRTAALERFGSYREAGADLVLCYPVAALEPFSSLLGTVLAAAPSSAVER
jgi:5,10-methylenetetrahydromethanopterin reductase